MVPSGGYYVLLDTSDKSGNLELPKHNYLSIWPETQRVYKEKKPIQFFCDSKQQTPKALDCRIRLTNIEDRKHSYISMYGLYMQNAVLNRHLTIGRANSEHNRKLLFTKHSSGRDKFELLPLVRRKHNDGGGISAVMRSEDEKYIRQASGGCLIADADSLTQAAHFIFKPR